MSVRNGWLACDGCKAALPLSRMIAAAARLMASVKVRAEGGEINAEPHPGCPDFFFGDLEGEPDA